MHQFGATVVMAEASRRELLADATRVRPVPASHEATGGLVRRFPRCRRGVGTARVWVGQRLQGGRSMAHGAPGAMSAVAPGRVVSGRHGDGWHVPLRVAARADGR